MASGSPDFEEPYRQEDQVSTDNQSGHFSDHEIDPNAATQMIENGRSFQDQNSDVDDQTETQINTSPDGQNENLTQDIDLEAPTQLQYDNDETGNTTQLLEQEHQGIDTQAATQITSEMDTFDTQTDNDKSEEPTQMIKESPRKSRSRSPRSGSVGSIASHGRESNAASRSPSPSMKSRSRSPRNGQKDSRSHSGSPRSRSSSPARSRSQSVGSRSRSRSGSEAARSRSNSINSARSRSMSRSRSRSRSKSRSKSRSRSRSMDSERSRASRASRSRSKSRSRSRSNSENRSDDDDISRTKKRVLHEAFGSGSEGEDNSSLKQEENADAQNFEVSSQPVDEVSNQKAPDSSDDDLPRTDGVPAGSNECDFDIMLERKKAETRRRRRKKDIDLINDNDDAIAKMIADMRLAAREDRELNQAHLPATKKISMLPIVMTQLNKADLQMAFVEANVLSVLTDWLAPMPDKSLPTLEIRRQILTLLVMLRIDDHSRLKESGIGKAVMYLYKHPKELRDNKDLAGRIINNWARPIFNLSTDFKSVDKMERMARDELLSAGGSKRQKLQDDPEEEQASRPGQRGWVHRARVPQPSTTSYVNRPEWTSDIDISRSTKRETTRLEKHMRAAMERKKNTKQKRAVDISIEGRKMNL